jgi:hypothetical protein
MQQDCGILTFCDAKANRGTRTADAMRIISGTFRNFAKVREVLSRGGLVLLTRNGAVDGVDQPLGLDEFDSRPLGLVAIKGGCEDFGKSVTVVGHSLARLFQRLKSLAHLGFAFCWPHGFVGAEGIAERLSSTFDCDKTPGDATPVLKS